ncbi:MAG: hypothetical protein ABIK28_23540 [Planctomycetota bacterium]
MMHGMIMKRIAPLVILLSIGSLISELQSTEPGDYIRAAGTIALPGVQGRLDHLSVDLQAKRLFVTCLENHTVEILDLAGQRPIHTLSGINEPQGVIFVPEAHRLLVCSRGDGTCRCFDTRI